MRSNIPIPIQLKTCVFCSGSFAFWKKMLSTMEEADYFYLQLFSEVRTHKLPIQGGAIKQINLGFYNDFSINLLHI